jgi:hypothetical protein
VRLPLLAAAAVLVTGCGPPPPEERGAERAVARAADASTARCTSRSYRWFVDGPPAKDFICAVRAEHGFCDRYRVDRNGTRYRVRLLERDASCTLPAG